MTFSMSEEKLSQSFKRMIRNEGFALQRRRSNCYVNEFDAIQGRADYVISPTKLKSLEEESIKKVVGGIRTPSSALVLSKLRKGSGVSESELQECIGLALSTIKRSLSQLESSEIIEKCGDSEYRILPSFTMPSIELWAIELKLHDWKRAFYQALQYRAFSHCAIVIVPVESSKKMKMHADQFRSFNIGVIAIDIKKSSAHTIVAVRRGKPSCDYHHIYAMANFLRRLQDSPNR